MKPILSLVCVIIFVLMSRCVPAVADEANARGLMNALGCKGCHRLQGQGGHLAPTLDRVGSRLTRSRLTRMFDHPQPVLPAHDLTFLSRKDRTALVDFLAGLKQPVPTYTEPAPQGTSQNSP